MRQSLGGFFSASVQKQPNRPALLVSGRSWTYQELDVQCRAVERALFAIGVGGPQRNVGVAYARGAFTYAAIIATMRGDSVYVPLNPKLPAERLLQIIDDAHIETLVVDMSEGLTDSLIETLIRSRSLHIIAGGGSDSASLNALLATAAPQHMLGDVSTAESKTAPPYTPLGSSDNANLAYIIYTSGSTGVPKGVAVSHHSACACIEKSHQLFGTHEQDRFTQFSALSFDVSILDLFLCWKSGAALCVPEASEALVPLKFAVTQGITVWSSVPSLANILLKLRILNSNALPSVRLILFCGEALPTELAEACQRAAPHSRVVNLYGPTECTIFATYREYQSRSDFSNGTVPIGAPLPGLRCMVVDNDQPIEADDVPGELWISGDQLAVGYWNNPGATQAAFVRFPSTDPQAALWYRTGDLVSRNSSSGLQFRGRLDRQVKLRGHRVELQEIESALRDVIGCSLVAVVPVYNPGGICEAIIAYCDELSADESTLKNRCLSRIPRYMVPDRILELESFPYSASGKVDYRALAALSTRRDPAQPL